MIRAYDKEYLDDAMSCLGEAMDYASQACGMDMDGFLELFIVSGLADQFAVGVPRVVSGMSGTELVMEVLSRAGMECTFPAPFLCILVRLDSGVLSVVYPSQLPRNSSVHHHAGH